LALKEKYPIVPQKEDIRCGGADMKQDAIKEFHPGSPPMPRNQWYVAAFVDEVSEEPMARTLLGERVVFYRTEQGEPVALSDYCPHRAMPLSMGKRVNGDRILCPYHGMEFGPDGLCRHIPSQKKIPPGMKVRSYPMVQRLLWYWIWMGDPDRADESLIPDHADFDFVEGNDFWKAKYWYMHFPANFMINHENVLDVSHVTFLHEGLVDSGTLASAPCTTQVDGNAITVVRRYEDVMVGDYAKSYFFEEGERVIRTVTTRTYVPSLNVAMNTFESLDHPERPLKRRCSPMAITPETEHSSHYFMTSGANFGEPRDEEALDRKRKSLWDVVSTDQVALSAIQEAMNRFGKNLPEISVGADKGALQFRRILARQFMDEQENNRN